LPDDCQITQTTLRPEQPPGRPDVEAATIGQTPWTEANPTSIRVMIEGDQRSLRIKEFLYDWAVPAASTAPLWKSPTLTPFVCQNTIGWLGTDYSGRHGACVQLDRTQIELSVYDGDFDDEELKRIMAGLVSANLEDASGVQSAPFFELNYWVRYKVHGPDVPYGLWDYSAHRRYQYSQLLTVDDLPVSGLPVLMPGSKQWQFDSAVLVNNPDENHRDVEQIYRHVSNLSDYLWHITMNADSEIAPQMPPQLAGHPTQVSGRRQADGRSIWYAAIDPQYGAWEAYWQESGAIHLAFAHSSLALDEDHFLETIGQLRAL
jgi:hypothetical protein